MAELKEAGDPRLNEGVGKKAGVYYAEGDPFLYEVFEDGSVVAIKDGQRKKVAEGSQAWDAILEQIDAGQLKKNPDPNAPAAEAAAPAKPGMPLPGEAEENIEAEKKYKEDGDKARKGTPYENQPKFPTAKSYEEKKGASIQKHAGPGSDIRYIERNPDMDIGKALKAQSEAHAMMPMKHAPDTSKGPEDVKFKDPGKEATAVPKEESKIGKPHHEGGDVYDPYVRDAKGDVFHPVDAAVKYAAHGTDRISPDGLGMDDLPDAGTIKAAVMATPVGQAIKRGSAMVGKLREKFGAANATLGAYNDTIAKGKAGEL
jgi:hypothetical protein